MSNPGIAQMVPYGFEKADQEGATAVGLDKRPVGSLAMHADGSLFAWIEAFEALAVGKLTMQKDNVTGHTSNMAVQAAAAVGATTISLTNASTAITKNQYADGELWINDVDGEGQVWKVLSHPAVGTTATGVFTLHPTDSVRVALTVSSQAGLRVNPYKDVELWDADDVDGPALGVMPKALAIDEQGWMRITGTGAVLADGTLVKGNVVVPSNAVDGAVEAAGATTYVLQNLGVVKMGTTDTEYSLVQFNIPLA